MSLTSFQLPIRGRPQKPLPTFQTKSHGLSSLLFTTKGPLKRTINNAFRTLDQGLCSFRSYKNSTKKPKLEVATRSGENAISLLDIALQRTAATKPRYSYTFCRNDSNRCTAKIKLHGKEFESDGTHSLQKAAKHCVADVACWWYFYGQMLEQLDSRTGLLGPEAPHFNAVCRKPPKNKKRQKWLAKIGNGGEPRKETFKPRQGRRKRIILGNKFPALQVERHTEGLDFKHLKH